MKQFFLFLIKEINNIRKKVETKFDKTGGEINGATKINGDAYFFGNVSRFSVGTALKPNENEGIIRFASNGTGKTDGAYIQYFPPSASNTGTNTVNRLNITSASSKNLDLLSIKANKTALSNGLEVGSSLKWSKEGLDVYGIDMNYSDLINCDAIAFSNVPTSRKGLYFPKPISLSPGAFNTIRGDLSTYDHLHVKSGALMVNDKEIIQGNKDQRSYFRAVTSIASTTSGGTYTFPFNVISKDNLNEFTTSTRRFYPNEAGLYQFNVTAKFKTVPQGTNVVLYIRAYTSSATERQFSTVYDNKNYYYGDFTASGNCLINLEKGDYVVVQYYSTENWAGQISTSRAETYFEGVRLA